MEYAIAFTALLGTALVAIYVIQKLKKFSSSLAAVRKDLKEKYYSTDDNEVLAFQTQIEDFVTKTEVDGKVQYQVAVSLNARGLSEDQVKEARTKMEADIDTKLDATLDTEFAEFANKVEEAFREAAKKLMKDVDQKIRYARVANVPTDNDAGRKTERTFKAAEAMIAYLRDFNESMVGAQAASLQREIDSQEGQRASHRDELERAVNERRGPYEEALRIVEAYETGALPESYSENGVLPYIEMQGAKTAKEKLALLGELEDPEKYATHLDRNRRDIAKARRSLGMREEAYNDAKASLERFDQSADDSKLAELRGKLAKLRTLSGKLAEVDRVLNPTMPKASARPAAKAGVYMPGGTSRPPARPLSHPPVDVDDTDNDVDVSPSSVDYSLSLLTSHYPPAAAAAEASQTSPEPEIPPPGNLPSGGLFDPPPLPSAPQRTCGKCSKQFPAGNNFCPHCGTEFAPSK